MKPTYILPARGITYVPAQGFGFWRGLPASAAFLPIPTDPYSTVGVAAPGTPELDPYSTLTVAGPGDPELDPYSTITVPV